MEVRGQLSMGSGSQIQVARPTEQLLLCVQPS